MLNLGSHKIRLGSFDLSFHFRRSWDKRALSSTQQYKPDGTIGIGRPVSRHRWCQRTFGRRGSGRPYAGRLIRRRRGRRGGWGQWGHRGQPGQPSAQEGPIRLWQRSCHCILKQDADTDRGRGDMGLGIGPRKIPSCSSFSLLKCISPNYSYRHMNTCTNYWPLEQVGILMTPLEIHRCPLKPSSVFSTAS